jgi:hypothetical protein
MGVSRSQIILVVGLLLPFESRAVDGNPVFAGVWAQKEPGGVGGLFVGQPWEGLVAHWREMGSNQYLADVEVYRENSEWRFAGLWRVGPGNGALYLLPWDEFQKKWEELKRTQDLIDLEVFHDGGGWKYLGVWRRKQDPKSGAGAYYVGLSWDELVARWKELGKNQYLAKVNAYERDGKRLFAGVWRVGDGNGALFLMNDWRKFAEMKRSLNATQEMLDFEMFPETDGTWTFLGVWRRSDNRPGPLHASNGNDSFRPLTADEFFRQWDRLKPTNTLVDLAIATPPLALRGDVTCKYGDVDCNRCANDVAKQFQLAFETGHRPWIGWNGGSWTFSGDRRYPPDNRKPEDAFKRFDEGLASKHVQGFVRTNSSRYPYAGSHSHKDTGSILFVERGDDGKHRLFSLHASTIGHPSGVAVLGDGLYVAEDDRLRWFGISAAIDAQTKPSHWIAIPKSDDRQKGLQGAGGGLGLAKLQDRSYLLVVTARGDGFRFGTTNEGIEQNIEPRYTRFYRIVGSDAGHPSEKVQFIGETKHEGTRKPDKPMSYSENLSVVTECGTGHLYTIHTTGQYLLNGDGYWRLSKIETDSEGRPWLRHIAIARQDQHQDDCHHRSSATVHVNAAGELEFLCTERSVAKMNPTGTFNFKEGKK